MEIVQPLPPTENLPRTRLLLWCGTVIAPLFLVVALAQMLTRPGFDIAQHAVSSLQNGDHGWVQSASFILCGLLAAMCAWGFRQVLRGSRCGVWGPLLVGGFGIGMIIAGLFPPDPAFGFPEGAPEGAPEAMSARGGMHSLGFFVAFMALIAACFVLARHFGSAMLAWRNASILVGLGTPLLIAFGGAAFPDAVGVFYLAAGAMSFIWLSAVARQFFVRTTEPQPE